MKDWATWQLALSFLFDHTLRKIDLGEAKMTADEVTTEVIQHPTHRAAMVTLRFFVVPK